jgi:MFS family permease
MNPVITASVPLLRHPGYARFLYVRVAASVAMQIQVVAVGWQMYALTDSAFYLGLIGLVQFVPAVSFFLATGHAADRYDRRVVTFAGEAIQAIGVGVLAGAAFFNRLGPELLLAMAFLIGTGRAFELPSMQSVLPNIVPAAILPRAVAGSTSAAQTAIVAGPALGGVLVAFSPFLVFTVCGLLWLSAGIVMLGIALERQTADRRPVSPRHLFSGIGFMLGNKPVLGAILLDLLAVLFGNAMALLPVFTRDIYLAGPLSFGLLRAAPAIGAITTALALTRRPISRHVGRVMFVTVAIFGLGTIMLGLAPNIFVAIIALIVIGASDTVSVVIRQTIVQLRTPDEMRGRVYSVNSVATITSNQLGDFRAGAMAALLGLIPSVLAGGVVILGIVLISTKIFSDFYETDRFEA